MKEKGFVPDGIFIIAGIWILINAVSGAVTWLVTHNKDTAITAIYISSYACAGIIWFGRKLWIRLLNI